MTPTTPALACNSKRLVAKLGPVGLKIVSTADIKFPVEVIDKTCLSGKQNKGNSSGVLRGRLKTANGLQTISVIRAVSHYHGCGQ